MQFWYTKNRRGSKIFAYGEEKKIVKRINEVSVDASFKVCKHLVN